MEKLFIPRGIDPKERTMPFPANMNKSSFFRCFFGLNPTYAQSSIDSSFHHSRKTLAEMNKTSSKQAYSAAPQRKVALVLTSRHTLRPENAFGHFKRCLH